GQLKGPAFVRRVRLVRYLRPAPKVDECDGAGKVFPGGIGGLEGAAHHDCAREVDVFGMGEDGHGEFESGQDDLEIRGAVAALERAVFALNGRPVMKGVFTGLEGAPAGRIAYHLLAGVLVVYAHTVRLGIGPFASRALYPVFDVDGTVFVRPAHGDGESLILYPFHGTVAEIDFRFRFGLRLVGGIYGFERLDVVFAETIPAQRIGLFRHDGFFID